MVEDKKLMDKLVALCKRQGFIFQSSDIYGGIGGFWDYGPLGVELKRNIREAWWHDMITGHDDTVAPEGAPSAYSMTGLECSIIMHPQVWKASGHYELFHDMMVDCHACKARFRADHIGASQCPQKPSKCPGEHDKCDLTEPREFNLMFKTHVGALFDPESEAYMRPETAQGMFVNFKNVVDTSRIKLPFGIAQIGKSFRNEITPRNFTFRSREFEQMEMEFFCRPEESRQWYEFWRDQRYNWYVNLGLKSDKLILRDHDADELSHYSRGTADIEYAFPFLPEGEYGELEGVAHRGDYDLRSHSEGKLVREGDELVVEMNEDGKPKYPGSGKDLRYHDQVANEKFYPHVIEPAAGCDRAALAFLCEAYTEDQVPDNKGQMQERVLMKFHPRLAPIKAAVLPLRKKDDAEIAKDIYRKLKPYWNVCYDEGGSIGRRYRRQDESGTPYCITVDGDTATDHSVTIRDRDTLEQERVPIDALVGTLREKLNAA